MSLSHAEHNVKLFLSKTLRLQILRTRLYAFIHIDVSNLFLQYSYNNNLAKKHYNVIIDDADFLSKIPYNAQQ